jgi:outer membrane receptor protein involved in Fe transport
METKEIVDLPLNGRDFTQLVALTPGATTAGQSTRTFASQVLVNGARSSKTTSTLDGILNIDQLFGGIPTSPSLDAIEEFRVQSGNFSAEQGMGPSNVSVTIKSGTNSFHGSAFEFLRNDKLDARNFFQAHRSILKRNQFGGVAGGPIKRNKIFFFVGYEGERQRDGKDYNITVPSAAQRQGNFSSLGTIRDPLTGSPFPNNVIPQSRIDTTANYFAPYFPSQNSGTQFVFSPSESLRRDQYNGRYDHYINDKNRVFARYTLYPYDFFTPEPIPSEGGDIRRGRSQNAAANWNRILNPSILNTLTLGWSRLAVTRVPSFLGTNHTVASGLQGFDDTSAEYPGFPNVSIGGYQAINGLDWWPAIQPTESRQIKDGFSVVHGAHQIKIGCDLRRYFWSSRGAAASRGDLTYSGDYTGNGWADFLLGIPVYAFRQYPQENYNQKSYNLAWYFQDDWRITPNLTLNLGLRYEYDTWPVDSRNQFSSFDPSLGKFVVAHNPGQGPDLTAQPLAALASQLFGSLIMNAKDAGLPTRSLRFPDKNNWGPRFGLAYRPSFLKNTVVRLGYGVFYSLLDANNYSDMSATSLPWIISQGVNNTLPVPTLNNHSLFAPFTALGATQPGFQPIAFDPYERIPYIQEWNVAVQRQLSNNISLEVAYVANKGTKLETRVPLNRPTVPGPGPVGSRRQFPQLSEGYSVQGSGLANYNSLQVKLEKKFSGGLGIVASYTLSKSIDDASSDFGSGFEDLTRLYLERAVSDFDIPQRLSVGYVYALPFGADRKFLSSAKGPVQQLLGGWQIGGIITLQSGVPFTVTSGRDVANIGTTSSQRPDRIASGNLADPTVSRWFDTAAFVLNAPYTFGNSGRNILRGDGMAQWDVSAMKYFPIREAMKLQFRAEFFNVFNHADFANPTATLTASTFGRVTGTSVNPRIGQFALKLTF